MKHKELTLGHFGAYRVNDGLTLFQCLVCAGVGGLWPEVDDKYYTNTPLR